MTATGSPTAGTTRVSPKHAGGRRARIVWHDTALKQITAMTPTDRARLDPLLAAIAADPTASEPEPLRSAGWHRMFVARVAQQVPVAISYA